jgi:glycosyltransferase involved in cell wall biosynthesis
MSLSNADLEAPQMRIAIIATHFQAHLSYLENVLCDALVRQGHEVRVFTASNRGERDDTLAVTVVRSNRVLRIGQTVLAYDPDIGKRILEFDPQIAFLPAPLHGLGWAWMKYLPQKCRVASAFSDLPWHRRSHPVKAWIKRRWARSIVRRSSIVLAITPETSDLLRTWCGDLLKNKLRHTGLIVDLTRPPDLAHLPDELIPLRDRYATFGALITRVTPEKDLAGFFGQIEQFLQTHPDVGFVIGGLDDGRASEELRRAVARSQSADRCVLLPMLCEKQIRAAFSIAAFSVWNSVSIGIYHSLACGCPAVLWSGQVSKHLIENGRNGFWFHRMDEAGGAMSKAMTFAWNRNEVTESVAGADADTVTAALVAELSSAS